MASKPLALVTGAAHRLGKAFALTLAREGYAVALHFWSSHHEAERTARELLGFGVPVFPLRADLSDAEAIPGVFAQLDKIPHVLRVLVNSAGVFRSSDPRDTHLAEWNLTMDLNLRAPFFCAQQAAVRMTTGGLILNITDVGARKSWTHFPAYTASKAALEALTRTLARAYAPGIRVNAIAPGLFLRSDETSDQEWQRLIDRLPLRRAGSMDELGAALQFLLHNEYITGQVLVVDGGYGLVA
jgi:pteridine reductase